MKYENHWLYALSRRDFYENGPVIHIKAGLPEASFRKAGMFTVIL
jgi:hypothetical protein